jgi:hypothetical protein
MLAAAEGHGKVVRHLVERCRADVTLQNQVCVPPSPHPLALFMTLAVWKDCSLLGEEVKGAKDWKLSSKSTGDQRRAETSQRERPVMTEAEGDRGRERSRESGDARHLSVMTRSID